MKRSIFAALMLAAALTQAQAASEVLTWTPPTTRTDGSALPADQIGGANIMDAISGTPTQIGSVQGAVGTFTTGELAPGTHVFTVVTCDTETPAVCSAPSNGFQVVIAAPPMAAPAAVTDLSGTPGP